MSDPGSDRSNRNGHSGKDGMAYGGLAYYDNPLFTHSYKGSFSENPDCHRHESGIYRPKKSRCLVAVIIIGLLLVVGIAVSLGVYFGVMEKTDKVGQVLSTEPVTTTLQPPTTTKPPATTTQAPVTTTQPPVTTTQPPVTTTPADLEDVCTDRNKISGEMASCYVYLLYIVNASNAENCGLYNYFIDCVINTVSDVGKTCREDSLRKWMPTAFANMGNPALEGLKNCPGYVDGVCKDEPIIQHIFMMACNHILGYKATRPCQVIQDTVTTCMLPSMPGSRCTGDQIGSILLKSSQITDWLPADFDPMSCGYSGIEGPGSCPAVTTVGICVENCTSNSSCTGGQKCCFNGCGHVCMDPVSNMSAERFQITFRINITWTEAYRNKNSTEYVTLQTNLENQLNQMLSNSTFKDIVEYINVIDFRPGSVMAVCELKLTEGKPLDDVKSGTRQIILQEQQKDPSPDNLLQAVDPDDIHVITLPDLEDVCTDMSKISGEMASCYVYLLYIVSASNAENCGMYNYYLDCIESKVTENGQRCEGDSLRSLMTTYIPILQRPELGYILNCPDYTDGICVDRAVIKLIFHDKCTLHLQSFTFLSTCKAFETIIDSCMNLAMPGSRCDKSVMLSALSSITVIANKLPQDFDIKSCSDPYAPSNCGTYGHGMDKPEVLECMVPFYDVNIDDLAPDVRCRMYDVLINCMNVQITADGVICDVSSLHTWLPDYFGQLKVNPDLLRNCTVGRLNSTTFCTDMNILEEFGNYSSCRALLQNFSSNPSCGSATTAFKCFEYILPQCDFMVVIQMMMSSPVFQSYIPPGFNIMDCATANNDTGKYTVDTCFGSWGSCVSTTNCHMVMWSYNPGTDLISFNITAAINPDTWIAIGFNKEAKMAGTDAIVSWITTDGNVTVTDRIITGYFPPPLDADLEQNILDIEGYRKDRLTNIMFRRPLTTANFAKGFQFSSTNCAYFIYAIGGNYNDGDRSITKHSNTPTISTDKICLPCSGDVCTDVETFRTIAARDCQSEIDQFSSSDNLITFCVKLNKLDACIKGALPTYGCPNEIALETYFKLLGLLDQLIGFSASSMATQCSS